MDNLEKAAEVIREATSVIVGAGAGMGVDSGLPDFRGPEGFWRAYPPLARLNLRFEESANPALFANRPFLAWGFYGHRTFLYRKTTPHAGFQAILDMAESLRLPLFAVTSNVDGQFQTAGFDSDRVYEIHGSIHHLQCVSPCSRKIWENELDFDIDADKLELIGALPECPDCGDIVRPNILMFGDWSWIGDRSAAQRSGYLDFMLNEAGPNPVYIEIGAGTSVPSIRYEGENAVSGGGVIIRINPREAGIREPHVSLPLGAEEALLELEKLVVSDQSPLWRLRNYPDSDRRIP